MASYLQQKTSQQKTILSFRITVWDVLTSLPAGGLIFMGLLVTITISPIGGWLGAKLRETL